MPWLRIAVIRAALIVLLWPLQALAQPSEKPARVGVIFNFPAATQFEPVLNNPNAIAFRDEMAKLGWASGRNLDIQWRTWEGDATRVPGIVHELLRRPVDLLVVFGALTTREILKQTKEIPVIMGSSSDPVEEGLVASLGRPGGNVTGMTLDPGGEIFGKRLGLLKDLVPGLTRVAYVSTYEPRSYEAMLARKLRLTLLRYRVTHAREVDAALADARKKQVGAALLDSSAAFSNPEHAAEIHASGERHRMPVMHAWLRGGLIAYASPGVDFRKVAEYVDRILKGAKPADLPIHQPSNYRLIVNMKAAKAIGLTVPPSILAQADQVIE